MRFTFGIFILALFSFSTAGAQEVTREQTLKKIEELAGQIKILEKSLFAPDAADLKQTPKGAGVFRLMPRERYDRRLAVQGGGAYYSFTNLSHDYQKIAQIGLEQNSLKVGFAGADYGFIADLGEIPLDNVTKENAAVGLLAAYRPPTDETEVRIEQQQARNYEVSGIVFKDALPAVVGRTYALRAISFGKADILVAFKIHRKDADGSLIIFWKIIEKFETPRLIRREQNPSPTSENILTIDSTIGLEAQNALWQKGFTDVKVETTIFVILRGSVPKGKMAEAVMTAQEAAKKTVQNQLIEK